MIFFDDGSGVQKRHTMQSIREEVRLLIAAKSVASNEDIVHVYFKALSSHGPWHGTIDGLVSPIDREIILAIVDAVIAEEASHSTTSIIGTLAYRYPVYYHGLDAVASRLVTWMIDNNEYTYASTILNCIPRTRYRKAFDEDTLTRMMECRYPFAKDMYYIKDDWAIGEVKDMLLGGLSTVHHKDHSVTDYYHPHIVMKAAFDFNRLDVLREFKRLLHATFINSIISSGHNEMSDDVFMLIDDVRTYMSGAAHMMTFARSCAGIISRIICSGRKHLMDHFIVGKGLGDIVCIPASNHDEKKGYIEAAITDYCVGDAIADAKYAAAIYLHDRGENVGRDVIFKAAANRHLARRLMLSRDVDDESIIIPVWGILSDMGGYMRKAILSVSDERSLVSLRKAQMAVKACVLPRCLRGGSSQARLKDTADIIIVAVH